MTSLILLSFIAGVLTVLVPCVLPLLPIIIGSAVGSKDRSKPFLVTAGLVISITIFTILLKASTLLITIDPSFWKYLSGILVLIFGVFYIFPKIWDNLSISLNLGGNSDRVLDSASKQDNWFGSMLVGGALGPVFASCSPTYALIIATILPSDFAIGIFYIFIYALGLASVMLPIAFLGRGLIQKLKIVANPNGWFKKILGVIFILVGLLIITGFDKVIETKILNSGFYDVTKFEQTILENNMPKQSNSIQTNKLLPLKQAPSFKGLTSWINSDKLELEDLKGKVVLVDFWTYSCINCQRTLPYITKWYDTYKDQGFVVVGVHAPEFAFEQKPENVQKAVKDFGINYPVALDNEFKTWQNYENRFWPAHYLINKQGQVEYTHFGEGKYEETEKQIRELLAVSNNPVKMVSNNIENKTSQSNTGPNCVKIILTSQECAQQSPESYLGSFRRGATQNLWTTTGQWLSKEDEIVAQEDGATLEFRFNGFEVFLVGQADQALELKITVDGKLESLGQDVSSQGIVKLKQAGLYKLVKSENFKLNSILKIEAKKGAILNVFTFG
jgi:cytochrome c biogenesis protein CcdA/thiol-disulfide isomerase/thioredoxin